MPFLSWWGKISSAWWWSFFTAAMFLIVSVRLEDFAALVAGGTG